MINNMFQKNINGVVFKLLADNSFQTYHDTDSPEYSAWVIAYGQPQINEDLDQLIHL